MQPSSHLTCRCTGREISRRGVRFMHALEQEHARLGQYAFLFCSLDTRPPRSKSLILASSRSIVINGLMLNPGSRNTSLRLSRPQSCESKGEFYHTPCILSHHIAVYLGDSVEGMPERSSLPCRQANVAQPLPTHVSLSKLLGTKRRFTEIEPNRYATQGALLKDPG